ncbi:MAG TPA: hypothetical protein VGL81_29410 [Polyangiaceae bacterium]|jgi:hypothetical protein
MRSADRTARAVLSSGALAGALLLTTAPARAVDVGSGSDLTSVEVHGFVSQGFIATKSNNYLDTDTTHGSFQFSEVGINFTKSITDKLRLGVQLFAQDFGTTGSYDIKADWFYVDYHWRDWLGFRAGRVKIPFGLYNEVQDIDSARVAVLLPQSVYPEQNRNYLLAQTGAEIYGYGKLGDAGALEYRLYGGTIFLDLTTPPGSPYQFQSLNVPYLAGGRLLWETPLEGLRVGGSAQTLRIDATVLDGSMSAGLQLPAVLWVGSAEYVHGDLLLAAEYSRWIIGENTTNPAVLPSAPAVTSERAYVMATYRAARWLAPGLYYALQFPNVDQRSGRENQQHDVATTLRFDINDNWLFKLEGHYMFGTAGLDPTLNNNTPLNALQQSWGVLLVKTTAYF